MRLAQGSGIAVGVAGEKADVVARRDSRHAEDSMAGEAHSRQGRLDMPEVRKSDVHG